MFNAVLEKDAKQTLWWLYNQIRQTDITNIEKKKEFTAQIFDQAWTKLFDEEQSPFIFRIQK